MCSPAYTWEHKYVCMYMLITCNCMLGSYVKKQESYIHMYVWWSNCYKSKWPMFNVLFCLFVYLLYFAVLWCLLTLLSCLLLTVCCFDGDDDDDDVDDDCAAVSLALFSCWDERGWTHHHSARVGSTLSTFIFQPLHLLISTPPQTKQIWLAVSFYCNSHLSFQHYHYCNIPPCTLQMQSARDQVEN